MVKYKHSYTGTREGEVGEYAPPLCHSNQESKEGYKGEERREGD